MGENRIVIVLIVCGCLFAWGMRLYKLLKENEKISNDKIQYVSIEDNKSLDEKNNGKIVFLAGFAQTESKWNDPEFNLKGIQALKFGRTVEMYQWEEYIDRSNDEQQIKYRKIWSTNKIDSSKFKQSLVHANPKFKISPTSFIAQDAKIGGISIPVAILKRYDQVYDYKFPSAYKNPLLSHGIYLKGTEPASPQIGDMRVQFYILANEWLSIMSLQEEKTLTDKPLAVYQPHSYVATFCNPEDIMRQLEKEKLKKTHFMLGEVIVFAIVLLVCCFVFYEISLIFLGLGGLVLLAQKLYAVFIGSRLLVTYICAGVVILIVFIIYMICNMKKHNKTSDDKPDVVPSVSDNFVASDDKTSDDKPDVVPSVSDNFAASNDKTSDNKMRNTQNTYIKWIIIVSVAAIFISFALFPIWVGNCLQNILP